MTVRSAHAYPSCTCGTCTQARYDKRPAFARFLWRDRTQEHWAESIAVDMLRTTLVWGTTIALFYWTRHWWVPLVVGTVCGQS
jgi:hypothetical protein